MTNKLPKIKQTYRVKGSNIEFLVTKIAHKEGGSSTISGVYVDIQEDSGFFLESFWNRFEELPTEEKASSEPKQQTKKKISAFRADGCRCDKLNSQNNEDADTILPCEPCVTKAINDALIPESIENYITLTDLINEYKQMSKAFEQMQQDILELKNKQ